MNQATHITIKLNRFIVVVIIATALSCNSILEPEPIDLLTDEVVLNEPKDVPIVEIGMYSAFRPIIPSVVIAGDFTADMLLHNGTFSQYRELGTKQITSANASVTALWGSIYNLIYLTNFVIERLPEVAGVRSVDRNRVMGAAHFLRGYAYFIALQTYGGVPLVTATSIEANRNVPRASETEILQLIEADFTAAQDKLPDVPVNAGFAGKQALHAAWAKFHLYQGNWAQAAAFATEVINSGLYELESNFATLVNTDFTREAIFEMGYTLNDDPGTSSTIGLNNLFVGRREIIPSNQTVLALASTESGDRFASIKFNANNLKGNDNGWSVAKYGTADENNNNVIVFRLAEMHLIRAEARARLGSVSGANSATTDINILRARAKAPAIGTVTQSQMLALIENERVYELAYEGHRWYDLVRTGRAATVMPPFNSNWRAAYERWPIPQRELQTNPALVGNQNPGY
ncbi:MAG: RagB/SusD family nutrient uptake outer membrane protein [Cyclobacteriaceae bacterium]|nr:RagB/SusD family nutrient uptake outer membrane protein [Cyclobacteriaceae bacterium]